MTDLCDLCRSPALEPVYQPPASLRRTTVHLCGHCGLVQSLPRRDRRAQRQTGSSASDDHGTLSHDKAFRTEACLSIMRSRADLKRPLRVLDVGSHRGSFARALLSEAPNARVTCVEPDPGSAQSCSTIDGADCVHACIEDTQFTDHSFDLIHSCRTTQHLRSPAAVFAEHWRTLKPGGLLVVDVPNLAAIDSEDIIDEWFTDNHLFHFSAVTLAGALHASGFEVIDGADPADGDNVLLAARKRAVAARPVSRATREADRSFDLITRYVANRARNLAALGAVAAEIASLAHKRIVLWGAGRPFDTLVLHGGLKTKSLALLIDTHLKLHVDERHGIKLADPAELRAVNPGLIVVMSRAADGEVSKLVKAHAPNAEIVLYADLLSRARKRLAA